MSFSLTAAAASPESAAPREFSAELQERDAAGAARGASAQVRVANGKVRIETPAAAGYFLLDSAAGTALLVRPEQRLFMDAGRSTRLTQVFVAVDPRDPCPKWQAAEKAAGVPGAAAGWRCMRISAVEYRVVSADGNVSQRWIDPDLKFPVKLRAPDGITVTLEHVRIAAQPAGLFELPPEYRKFDPQGIVDRIKRSDVWAAPASP